jgi:uncharacterized small protein (DUF1192 family)
MGERKFRKFMEELKPTLCNDMMSWEELADRVLELEAEVARLTALVQEHQTYQTRQGDKK